MQTIVQDVSEYELFCQGRLPDPYPFYHRIRAEDPVHWSELMNCWLVTRYEDVLAGLRDLRLSSERTPIYLKQVPVELQDEVAPLGAHLSNWVSWVNPPDHTRLRRLINIAFSPRVIETIRPRIQSVVDDLLDGLQGQGEMDLVRDFAYPLPAVIISEMLGVAPQDREQFKRWSDDLVLFLGGTSLTLLHTVARSRKSLAELSAYFQGVIAESRARPKDNLISHLVAAEAEGDKLNEAELVAMCTQLGFAGHETTTNLIANGMLALFHHPAQLQKLRDNPALMPSAIEEMLRYESPAQRQTRYVSEEMTFGGRQIQKGDMVMLMLNAANRDPAVFSNPDTFDITRDPNRHLSFSYGIHFCVGAPLARLEASIAIAALLQRLPNLALAAQDLHWHPNLSIRGLESLRVTF